MVNDKDKINDFNVFDYRSIDQLLIDLFRNMKVTNPKFSFEYMRKRFRGVSSSHLRMIARGYRIPSSALMDSLALFVGFAENEVRFVQLLLCVEKLKNDHYAKEVIEKEIEKIRDESHQLNRDADAAFKTSIDGEIS